MYSAVCVPFCMCFGSDRNFEYSLPFVHIKLQRYNVPDIEVRYEIQINMSSFIINLWSKLYFYVLVCIPYHNYDAECCLYGIFVCQSVLQCKSLSDFAIIRLGIKLYNTVYLAKTRNNFCLHSDGQEIGIVTHLVIY